MKDVWPVNLMMRTFALHAMLDTPVKINGVQKNARKIQTNVIRKMSLKTAWEHVEDVTISMMFVKINGLQKNAKKMQKIVIRPLSLKTARKHVTYVMGLL